MATEQTTFCDLCGDEVEEAPEDNISYSKDWSLSISRGMEPEKTEYDMWKDLCEDCTKKVYNVLTDLDWEN